MSVGEMGDAGARMNVLSPGKIPPVCSIRWLTSGSRVVIFDAFPDIYASSIGVPYATLTVQFPVDILFPYSCRVADERHIRWFRVIEVDAVRGGAVILDGG